VDSSKASKEPFPAGAVDEKLADSDGDGLLNYEESLAGTDPFSDDSTFVVRLTPPVDNTASAKGQYSLLSTDSVASGFSLDWVSRTDNNYTVEISLDMSDWAVVPGFDDVPGTGSVMSYTNNTSSALFFRLKTRPSDIP
jgi:hypothetical protein